MKILMLTHEFPPFRGGIATYTAQLARAAQQIGHEITVVAPDFGLDCAREDRAHYPFTVERYHASTYNYRQLPQLLIRAYRQGRRPGFDLFHAVDPSYTMALAFLNHFRSFGFIATAYGTEILSLRIAKQARFLRTGDLFERASRVFAISEYTKSLVERYCTRVDMKKVFVTPLGVDPFWFGEVKDHSTVGREFHIPPDNKVILTVARLDERKGHPTVLRGIAGLNSELKATLTYVIIGRGNDAAYNAKLRQLAALSGVNMVFAENLSDEMLRQLYCRASVFCMPGEAHPKKVEGFGLVYLEAAAQGLPSIGSRIGAVSEVIRHDETGLLIESGNVNEFTQALTRLLSDPKLCRTLGENARQWARLFSWQKCAELTYGVPLHSGTSIRSASCEQ